MLRRLFFFFSSRRRHTRFDCDWSSDVCSSDLQFKQLAGIDLQHVPYKGGSQIMTDMLGGHIETGFTSTLTVLQHYKSGKLKVLAVAGKARHPSMPDVPTAIESGYPEYETYAWYGMYGPRGMPGEVVARIQQEIARILKLADMNERLSQFRAVP